MKAKELRESINFVRPSEYVAMGLTEIQRRRTHLFVSDRLSFTIISKIEGVSRRSIRKSIMTATTKITKSSDFSKRADENWSGLRSLGLI